MAKITPKLQELLTLTAQQQASDLHLGVGRYPIIRLYGQLTPLTNYKILDNDDVKNLVGEFLNKEQLEKLERDQELDVSYSLEEKARFRANVYYQRGGLAIAMRHLPARISTIEELNLPAALHIFTKAKQGFVLVTGPTGEGKSTTLASMIDEINHTRNEHIIAIEDPIEYVFIPDNSIIDQREVGKDTKSFYKALRSTFREDADVIMIGEMRDPETMAAAVTAAETGHLVFSTLHTNDAAQTVDRIIDSFPSSQQNQIRIQLASSLLGIISQRLISRVEGGLIPAVEILIADTAVSNLIREKKTHQLNTVIETGSEKGMISLNRSLIELVEQGLISMENAEKYSMNPTELRMLIRK